MPLYRIGKNRWTNRPPEQPAARSDLPRPMVISDTMDPVEQVDGSWHTSKAKFRAVGRSLGLTEMGNDRRPPKTFTPDPPEARRKSIRTAIDKYKAGHRPKPQHP